VRPGRTGGKGKCESGIGVETAAKSNRETVENSLRPFENLPRFTADSLSLCTSLFFPFFPLADFAACSYAFPIQEKRLNHGGLIYPYRLSAFCQSLT